MILLNCDYGYPLFVVVGLGIGVIAGIVGAIFARIFLPSVPASPVPAALSTAIEALPSRDMP